MQTVYLDAIFLGPLLFFISYNAYNILGTIKKVTLTLNCTLLGMLISIQNAMCNQPLHYTSLSTTFLRRTRLKKIEKLYSYATIISDVVIDATDSYISL